MNAENFFISLFAGNSVSVGDDGALMGRYVYSQDAFFENVHFRMAWMNPEQIAYKAMLVNISDAIAMNARPRYALLTVAMPRGFTPEAMRSLHRGFQRAAGEFGVEIVGGDTIANIKLDISVTIVSEVEKPLLRRGLKPGHLIAHTGRLGGAAKALRYLMAGGKAHRDSAFVRKPLRSHFVTRAAPALSCGMDISDGLFSDLSKLSEANRLGFRLDAPVCKHIACSGEEYEMLVGVSPRNRKTVMRIAQKSRTPLKFIGRARRGRYVNRCKAHHF